MGFGGCLRIHNELFLDSSFSDESMDMIEEKDICRNKLQHIYLLLTCEVAPSNNGANGS